MRRRARTALAGLAALVLVAAFAPGAQAKRVRVFAVGPKLDLSWLDTPAHFHDKLFALFDKHLRTGAAPPIQRDARDVASSLLGPEDRDHASATARDLVVLPEDLGLMASFTGVQGLPARASQLGLTGAILGLIGSYAPQAAYYESKYMGLAQRPFPPTRLLGIALTDTFARVAVETFAELADKYDVYLEAGIDMAQDWKVVCVSKSSFVASAADRAPCAEESPAKVALLRSPDDPASTYAYEATTDRMSNMALVFDPDGRLVSRQIKTYITPTELPGQLDLTPGSVSSGLSALPTPVGTLGFVTSKDAWMPDVIAKLDEAHVDLLVQPEFFVNDTVKSVGMWAPDNLKASGFSALLRAPSFEAMALSSMTGNVFEFSADAQQAIAVKPRATRGAPAGGLVGQELAPGLSSVGRWVVQDPMESDTSILARRRRLAAAGEKLLPTGPACARANEAGPCKGGQVEDVVFQDVDVGVTRRYRRARMRRRGRTPFSRSRALSASHFVQRNVDLAGRGRRAYAAFEERRGGGPVDQIYLARSHDGGSHWLRRRRPTGRSPGTANERWPSIAVGPDGIVWAAWQDDSTETERVYYSRSTDGGRTFSPPTPVDPTAPSRSPQRKPSIAAVGAGIAAIAWIDERDRFAGETDLPQANVYFARVRADGPARAIRLDTETSSSALAATLDNDWAPSVAADGDRVAVAWLDFRTYDWDVVSRASTDGGAIFGPLRTVSDAPGTRESLEDTPSVAMTGDGPLVAFTDYRKRADTDTDLSPHQLYDTFVAAPAGPNRRVDQHGSEQVSTFAPSLVALPGGDALVAWQDMGRGPGDIFIARVKPGAGGGRAIRVDDTGSRGWNQWRPALALSGGRVLAAWEDERDGPAQIYLARVRPARIR